MSPTLRYEQWQDFTLKSEGPCSQDLLFTTHMIHVFDMNAETYRRGHMYTFFYSRRPLQWIINVTNAQTSAIFFVNI